MQHRILARSSRFRGRVARLSATVFVVATASRASADHCHSPPPDANGREPSELGLRVWVSLEAAAYDNAPYEGDYEGAALGASFQRGPLQAWAVMPSYRLLRSGQEFLGIGDLLTGARFAVLQDEAQTLAAGFTFVATWPSGDRTRDLGMGHVMIMPGIWAAWRVTEAFVHGELSYARAIASSADRSNHQDGPPVPRPLVDPMNSSEGAARLAAGYFLVEQLRARSSIYGAVPIADEHGAARGIVSAGVDLVVGSFETGLEGQVPVVGDPFTFKIVLTAAGRF